MDGLISFASAALSVAADAILKPLRYAKNGVKEIFETIVKKLPDLPSAASKILKGLANTVDGLWLVGRKLKDSIIKGINAVVEFIVKHTREAYQSIRSKLKKEVTEAATEAATKGVGEEITEKVVKETTEDVIEDAVEDGVQDAIEDGISDAAIKGTRSVYDRGKEIFDNFNIDEAYVKPKHLSGTKGNGAKFIADTKVEAEAILKDSMTNGKIVSIADNGITKMGSQSYKINIDAGKVIGTKGETKIKIVLSADGGMLSAYPVH